MINIWPFGVGWTVVGLMIPTLGSVIFWHRWNLYQDRLKNRRHPLTKGLLRPAGHSLATKIAETQFDLAGALLAAPLAGAVIILSIASTYTTGQTFSSIYVAIVTIAIMAFCIWNVQKALRLFRKLKQLKLGWEGELATAEELNKLMRSGYDVFHDIQEQNFNVDHVVVGPSGVYVIETKAYTKQKRGQSDSFWRATYDGKTIDFAGYTTSAPLDQAARNAKWVSKWLSQATGERVTTIPVVALPGWYVDRKARGDVRVINSSEVRRMTGGASATALSPAQIQRISHQLDQHCRDVAKDKLKRPSTF